MHFGRNIIRIVLLFCAIRVIYVLPNKERWVHIMKNEIRFTLKSKQRPKLAQEIGNILGTAPHYERVPSCAYDIAGYRLDKEGVLHTRCFLSSTFPRKKRRNSLLSSRDFPCFQRALCIPAHKGMLHSVAFPFEDQ